jgi:type IV pilus assembly protein PilW
MKAIHASAPRGAVDQGGYTLVELMIAITIALFLLAGVMSIFSSVRRTSLDQTGLAQLQDDERVAMLMLDNAVQQAGYSGTITGALTATTANFPQQGQAITGGTNAYGDTLTVRYAGDASGTIFNCLGSTMAAGALQEMQFSIQLVNGQYQLACAVNGGQPVPLVRNVRSLSVRYGVASGAAQANAYAPVDAYLDAAGMNANAQNWTNVSSVKITVTFLDPLAGQFGRPPAGTITFTAVIGVMGQIGVNSVTYT